MKIKVWDIPTRVFHWLLAASFLAVYLTSESERLLEYHTAAGYAALGLVLFRLLWGFAGNRYARFTDFIKGWGSVKGYIAGALRLKPPRYLGHNPAVGWVVVFMLLMILALNFTGIIVYSGEEMRGAFAGAFSFPAALKARLVHEFLACLAIIVIVVHVSAALFHDFILRENIILSMFTGKKEDPESWAERVSHLKPGEGRSALRLSVGLFAAVMGGLGLVYLPPESGGTNRIETARVFDPSGRVVTVERNALYEEECGSCHNAFHPTLLPSGSWQRVMSGLSDHFGEDVTLDPETSSALIKYLAASSAERSLTEASRKILHSIDGDPPLRITDTAYWEEKHSEIEEEVYGRKSVFNRINCAACHHGSGVGSFEDKDITIPER